MVCGRCEGCLLDRSRQWAIRIMHEAQLHERNSFVTLTYADAPQELVYRDYQLFMKRLRKSRGRCRFYCGGEYGERYGRPHFHAVLFGYKPDDGVFLGKSPAGFKLFRSDALSALWPEGFVSFGDVTFESAAYVARYVLKKADSNRGMHFVDADGVVHARVPEFSRMSLRPAIGAEWLKKFGASDVFPDGQVVLNGRKTNAPRYYMKWLRSRNAMQYWRVMHVREKGRAASVGESLPGRLEPRHAVLKARLSKLKRELS